MKQSGPPSRRTPLPGPSRPMTRAPFPVDLDRARKQQRAARDRQVTKAREQQALQLPPQRIERDRPARGSADRGPARPPVKTTGPSEKVLAAVARRDKGRCVRCGAPSTNTHHREGRGMGGRKGIDLERVNGLAYLLSLCGSGSTGCHGLVTTPSAFGLTRKQVEDEGYVLRRNSPLPADRVPVLTEHGWERFTDDGGRTPWAA